MSQESALPPEITDPLRRSWTDAEAQAYCTRLTQGHYENFPVGSFLIPKELQPAVHSLYAFMRTADDFSDENRKAGDEAARSAWLSAWETMLSDCEKGQAVHPIFIALRRTLRRHELPAQWLHDLLHAFKMDVTVRRYATHQDLLTYCGYSANPVGRLILTLFGYRDQARYQWSDAICTGLQLANHWQDVAVDLKKDRIYVPQEDMKRFGVTEEHLFNQASPSANAVPLPMGEGIPDETRNPLLSGEGAARPGEAIKTLLAFEVARARALFEQGRALPEKVKGRLAWELRLTWQGGVRILDKIEQADYDVFTQRPVVTTLDWAIIAVRCLLS